MDDFLKYEDENGLFADFHANRHTFISNLARAGVPLAIAQKLARHSDPRLTANRYTHLEINDQAAAISSLPRPQEPVAVERASVPFNQSEVDGPESLVVGPVAGTNAVTCPCPSPAVAEVSGEGIGWLFHNPIADKSFDNECRLESRDGEVHPGGLEPPTFGSVGQPVAETCKLNRFPKLLVLLELRMNAEGEFWSPPRSTVYRNSN